MIRGMARAGRYLQRPEFVDSAANAVSFVRENLWHDGRLRATARAGRAHLEGYLDDYVLMIDGLIELVQARWHSDEFGFALELAEALLSHFEDSDRGGFFFTANDHERLLHRHKPTTDDAVPSGNGIAAATLIRLGHILGERRYLDAGERTLKALAGSIARFPSAHGSLLVAVEEYLFPTQTIVLRGERDALAPWVGLCQRHYAPRRVVLGIPQDGDDLPGALAARAPGQDTVAYVCEGFACSAPLSSLDELGKLIGRQPETPESTAPRGG